MPEGFVTDVKTAAKDNEYFRKVLFTASHSQLVIMSLLPGEEIGMEVHDVDQTLYVVDGAGMVVFDGVEKDFEKGMVVVVPAGVRHNVVNTDDDPMKLFTIYAPPQHAVGTVHRTRAEAETSEERYLETAKA
jgi:mannose-6-phosphate isomerase-like protein (cupin superfamily)